MELSRLIETEIWGGMKWLRELERRMEDSLYLEQYGYKVYSQNDEDGIIHEIFNRIGTTNKQFIEFGVDIGLECNCHALLLQGFKGLWIEGRKEAYKQIVRRFAPAIRQGNLFVKNGFVDKDNVNEMISCPDLQQEIDLLSIDIDGNDWHVWKAVTEISPRVVVIEYNAKFAPEIDWHMAYNKNHVWDRSDMQGASLKALELLGEEKGYQLVGTTISGINAFFVRKDLIKKGVFPEPATAENLYNPFRSSLHHRNGHRAKNYVGQDIEGMEGTFEYYPDWNFLPSHGFYPVDVISDHKRIFWMQDKEATLFLRGSGEKKQSTSIRISYCADDGYIKNGELPHLRIRVDGKEKGEFALELGGVLDIPCAGLKDYVPIELWLNELVYSRDRNSMVGVGITDISVHNNKIGQEDI